MHPILKVLCRTLTACGLVLLFSALMCSFSMLLSSRDGAELLTRFAIYALDNYLPFIVGATIALICVLFAAFFVDEMQKPK